MKGRPGKVTHTNSRNGGADVAVRSFADFAEHVAHATGKPIICALCVVVELKVSAVGAQGSPGPG